MARTRFLRSVEASDQTHMEVIYEANPTNALFQMLTQP